MSARRAVRPDGRVRRRRASSSRPRTRVHEAGYRKVDAYTPFPIEELTTRCTCTSSHVPQLVLAGGLLGGLGGLRAAVLRVGRSRIRSTSAAGRSTAGRRSWSVTSRRRCCFAALRRGVRHAGARTACRSRTTRCSTCRASRWRAATASSCASRRTTRSSTSTATRRVPAGPRSRARCRRWSRDAAAPAYSGWTLLGAGSAVAARRWRARPAARTCTTSPSTSRCGESELFADERSARPLVAGTVARGSCARTRSSTPARSGQRASCSELPRRGDGRSCSARGQERFQIFCSPCHGRTGSGDGMVVRRGFKAAAARTTSTGCAQMPIGYFFDVMTNGFGAMADYAAQVAAGGPLGDRRLHPRAAAQRVRAGRRRARPTSAGRSSGALAAAPGGGAPPMSLPVDTRGGSPRFASPRPRADRAGRPRRGRRVFGLALVGRLRVRPRPVLPLLPPRVRVLGRHRRGLRWVSPC